MRWTNKASAGAALALLVAYASGALACPDPDKALGVSRFIEIDTSGGAIFGSMTKRDKEESFLAEGEVVLTFDDGPVPWVTKPILDTLDTFCTKATFFSVGEMAVNYPAMTKDVLARGHTVGTHTWSHPNNLRLLSIDKAKDEIERGFAAVALAASADIAPFFRFPGLNDSDELLTYLQSRSIASFTVDVISNDSFIGSPQRIAERTLKQAAARGGGILLFHDLKRPTAKALPAILAGLKAKGFKIVHLTAKTPAVPLGTLDAELQPVLAKASSRDVTPFYGPIPPPRTPEGHEPATSELAPPARTRLADPPDAPDKQASSAP
ncbi:polysaccharide deacetylase family protein [Hyphomicrobium sp.]|uniref:polysaccharide deacetylase family protein n=1 Tax=Hyphomicrobium sp. TaxID=82 RepID=UPI0025BA1A3F|nr:polysaccharide deacetylase family protein [Hyphomicrobium sp.]MCC7251640.1 polysaccharide deacetylase family protein [Hyphomicrobium sp.]